MEMDRFLQTMIIDFCIAFGFLVGGCLLGGLGAFIVGDPPMRLMVDLADKLKIWAVVASIGGTFDAISTIERGFFYGSHGDIVKQLLFVFSAILGAFLGSMIIKGLVGGELQ